MNHRVSAGALVVLHSFVDPRTNILGETFLKPYRERHASAKKLKSVNMSGA